MMLCEKNSERSVCQTKLPTGLMITLTKRQTKNRPANSTKPKQQRTKVPFSYNTLYTTILITLLKNITQWKGFNMLIVNKRAVNWPLSTTQCVLDTIIKFDVTVIIGISFHTEMKISRKTARVLIMQLF